MYVRQTKNVEREKNHGLNTVGCVANIEATLFELMENVIMWKMWNSGIFSSTDADREKETD